MLVVSTKDVGLLHLIPKARKGKEAAGTQTSLNIRPVSDPKKYLAEAETRLGTLAHFVISYLHGGREDTIDVEYQQRLLGLESRLYITKFILKEGDELLCHEVVDGELAYFVVTMGPIVRL